MSCWLVASNEVIDLEAVRRERTERKRDAVIAQAVEDFLHWDRREALDLQGDVQIAAREQL